MYYTFITLRRVRSRAWSSLFRPSPAQEPTMVVLQLSAGLRQGPATEPAESAWRARESLNSLSSRGDDNPGPGAATLETSPERPLTRSRSLTSMPRVADVGALLPSYSPPPLVGVKRPRSHSTSFTSMMEVLDASFKSPQSSPNVSTTRPPSKTTRRCL